MTIIASRSLALTTALLTGICLPAAAQASKLALLMAGPLASDGQPAPPPNPSLTYPIVDTDQTICADQLAVLSTCPASDADFYGQDAQYTGNVPSYSETEPVSGEKVITDTVTGLMWQKNPGDKKTYTQAVAEVGSLSYAGYTDWRLPTIKELYSLILFSGQDPSGCGDGGTECTVDDLTPFINTDYFLFRYGDRGTGERIIDSQYLSSTEVKGGTGAGGDESFFGVNFADGRIKGYSTSLAGDEKTFFVMYVRDVADDKKYGVNDFKDNGDGTVTDQAAGLQWMQADSGDASLSSKVSGYTKDDGSLNWQEALHFCENLSFAGHDDWHLPNAKELQSIVDYTRSPSDNPSSPAIDPIFSCTSINNEADQTDWPFYWTSTTHQNYQGGVQSAAYLSFGRAMGNPSGSSWVDVHGAGAQRSDPKYDDGTDYSDGHGPQKDAVRIYNYVRCVREAS